MPDTHAMTTVRECAMDVIAAMKATHEQPEALMRALKAPVQRLLDRPDLLSLGIPRVGNNVAFSQYLYFDGEMSILIYQVPKDKPIAPHDHGIWETMFVYRGRVKHTVYERIDDGSCAGHAELRVTNDGVLERGDCAIVAPPSDIHGFVALTDDTYAITIVNGAYKADRHYYKPDENTYEIRAQRNAR